MKAFPPPSEEAPTGTRGKGSPDPQADYNRKHGIKLIRGKRVAHMTTEKFQDVLLEPKKFETFRANVDRVVIEGASGGMRLEFLIDMSCPSIQPSQKLVSTRDIRRQGFAGALQGRSVVNVVGGSGDILGRLRVVKISPALQAHGVSSGQGDPVIRHSTGQTDQENSFRRVFASTASLEKILRVYSEGVRIVASPQWGRGPIDLGMILPWKDRNSLNLYSDFTSVACFRNAWEIKFVRAAADKRRILSERLLDRDLTGVVLYSRIINDERPDAEPIAVFTPRDYKAPA